MRIHKHTYNASLLLNINARTQQVFIDKNITIIRMRHFITLGELTCTECPDRWRLQAAVR